MLFFYTYLERSDWLVCNFSGKSDEILFLGPIIPNLGFEKKNRKVFISDLYSTPSKYLECKFSSRPICPNLDFNGL